MKSHLALMFLILFFNQWASAQSELKLPNENQDLAKEKYVILSDYHDSKDVQKAYDAYIWIIGKAPDMHETVYIFGLKAIHKLMDQRPDVDALKDDLMEAYDLRIKYFGHEIKVLNRKAYDAYKYFRNDTSRLDEIISIFDYLYQNEKEGMKKNLIYPFFDLKVKQLDLQKINNQDLITFYQNITDVIQYQMDNGDEDMEKIQQLIDARLVKNLEIDCGTLDKVITKDADGNLTLQQAKLTIKLSLVYNCKDDPLFLEGIKVLFEEKPTLKFAKLIASFHLSKKEYSEAISYYNKALELSDDPLEKSDIYLDIANVYYAKGDKINSRKMAYQALKLNAENLAGYKLIGDLYYNSYDECKKGVSRVADRSVFIAAYEKYLLAQDHNKMSLAEQQFPTIDEIHTENHAKDEIINTNCWIGEPVKIRRRPDLASQ